MFIDSDSLRKKCVSIMNKCFYGLMILLIGKALEEIDNLELGTETSKSILRGTDSLVNSESKLKEL